jgi:hypothetical protein
MQFRKLFVLLLFLILPPAAQSLKAQAYVFEELTAENLTAVSPFSIAQVVPIDGGLRIFISTDNPDAVAGLLATGALLTQLSDHVAMTEAPVPISFGKAVWCTADGDPVYLAYQDPLPSCGGQPPAIIEYYFDAAAVLGPGRDLALGLDPNFLWLIAEQ